MFYYQFTNLWIAHTSEDSTSLGRLNGVVLKPRDRQGQSPLDPMLIQLHTGESGGKRSRPEWGAAQPWIMEEDCIAH